MTYTDEDVVSKIEFTKTLIEDAFEDIEQGYVPNDRLHIAKRSIGKKLKAIGIYHGLLGNKSKMRTTFSRAGEYYIEGVRLQLDLAETDPGENLEEVPLTLAELLRVAVLSADEDLLANAVQLTRGFDESYLDEYPETHYKYYYAKAYAEILAGVDSKATVESLSASIPEDNNDVAMYYRCLLRTLRGLNTLDEGETEAGLSGLLSNFADKFSEQIGPAGHVCVPVVAFAVTAQRRGMDVWPDSRFVPEIFRPDQ
ncbi:hypothetical protein ACH9L7_09945 [Haloferax sp. S1W]|uniref:hypothetical protein n=1 Tax=Haloferax sp. S1W TaxID=3377110 RepID=UPI0037C7FCE5